MACEKYNVDRGMGIENVANDDVVTIGEERREL